MLIVAGRDCGDRGIEIFDNGALQILRLKTFAGPAPGRCSVKPEGAADTIVVAGTSEQSVDLLDRRLGTAEPELEHAPHLPATDLPSRAAARSLCGRDFCRRSRARCSHLQEPRDLVDAGDGAGGELSKLGIDLRRRRLLQSYARLRQMHDRHRSRGH